MQDGAAMGWFFAVCTKQRPCLQPQASSALTEHLPERTDLLCCQPCCVGLMFVSHLSGVEHDTRNIVDMSAQRVDFPSTGVCTHTLTGISMRKKADHLPCLCGKHTATEAEAGCHACQASCCKYGHHTIDAPQLDLSVVSTRHDE